MGWGVSPIGSEALGTTEVAPKPAERDHSTGEVLGSILAIIKMQVFLGAKCCNMARSSALHLLGLVWGLSVAG